MSGGFLGLGRAGLVLDLMLNDWPRLGTKGFLERTPWLKSKLAFLALVTGVSLVGFVV